MRRATKNDIIHVYLNQESVSALLEEKQSFINRILKTLSSNKAFKRLYQTLKACFRPYKALWSLKTWLENLEFSKSGGCLT
jgi:hypothetical protein